MADPDRDPRNNPQPPAPKPVQQKTTTVTRKPSYDWQRAAYGKYRRPGYSSRGDQRIKPSPLPNRLRLGPENYTVSEEFLNNPEAQRQFRNRSTVLRMPAGQNQVEDIAVIPKNETFWENPQRVARYRQFIASAPPETELPSWLDVGAVNQAYDYFKSTNPGRPWYLWQPPQEDDPARVELANIPVPPPDAMLIGERERFYGPSWKTTADDRNVYAVDLATAQRAFAPEQLSMFPVKGSKVLVPATYLDQYVNGQQNEVVDAGMYQPQQPQDLQNGIPADVWEQLPWWQKVIIPILPSINTGMGVISGGLAGLSMGGPLGAVVGGAAGGGLAVASEKNKTLADLMMKLDIPAEYLERASGVFAQVKDSIRDPEKYGAVGEVLDNLPAAWEAAHLAYNVDLAQLTGPDVTAWELGNPTPNVWRPPDGQVASSWALTEARRRIANRSQTGETTDEIWADISGRFGFAGEVRDMFGHMLLDPLNLMGEFGKVSGSELARAAGNVELEKAFRMTKEPLDAVRQYGQSLRRLPPAELAQFDSISRFIAGVDKAGNLKDLQQAPRGDWKDIRTYPKYFAGMDAKSRAAEVLATSVGGLQVALSDVDDPVMMVKMINSVAKMGPDGAIRALDGSDLPRWFESAEAQAVPQAIHDQLPKAQAMLDEWQITRPQATILQRVAEFMGIEPEKLIADLHNAKPGDADTIFRVFLEKAQQRAAGGDAAAQRIVKALTSDQGLAGLDGRKLKQMADLFTGENGAPLRAQEFKYRLLVSLTEGVDNWAAKWFNVKPAHWVYRMNGAIKKAQGLVLLGLNPTYVFNNALNNMVTLAWDGLLGFSTGRSKQRFFDEMGFTPARLTQGVAPSDTAQVGGKLRGKGKKAYEMGQGIRKAATEDKGTIAALDDFFGKGDKLAIFATFSQWLEGKSSEMATVTAMRQFWDRSWREGVGFDRMPGDLRMALDAVQPGLADRVTKAIRRGKSRQAIEREIFSDLGKRSVRDVLGPQEAALMSHFPDVMDDLDAKVRAAETPEQVRSAFTDARAAVQRRAAEEIGRQVQTITQNAATRIQVEGGQAVLDIMDDIAGQRSNFWLEHFRKMDDVARQADSLTGPARSALWQNALREADREWNTFLNIEGAKILGAFKGLGVSDATYAQITRNLTDMHDNWQAFFAKRRELMDKFADAADGLTPEERTALWHQVNRELNADYVDALLEEDRLTGLADELFAKAYERQGQGLGDSARVWRKSVQDVRRQMAMAMVQYRAGDIPAPMLNVFGSILPQQVADAIRVLNGGQPVFALDKMTRGVVQRRFYQDVYTPFIRQMLEASNANTPGAPVRPGIPQGQPIIPEVDAAAPAGAVDVDALASRMDDLEAGLNAVTDATPPKTAAEPETLDTTPADLPNPWEAAGSKAQEGVAQVPVMITQAMRKQLMDAGYTPAQIKQMTPTQAWEAIQRAQSGTPVQTPAPAAAGADVPAGPVEPVRAPRGTADQLIEPPIQEANWEGWLSQIAPLFDRAEEALASPAPAFSLEGADAGTVRGLRAYLGQVYEQLNETKMGALRWGESKRDAALLNYSRRYGFDNVLGTVMPYEFWYTHSMLQWALRALAKPAMFANYARVKTYAEDAVEREGFPTRLRKKIAIPAPYLPEWMGGNIYIDPMRQLFPFETFARPWETLAEQQNQEQRRAEGILQEMVADESTTAEEAAQALQSRSGPLWDQALAQARGEIDADIANPLDFAFMMSGPSLPISIGRDLLLGRKDEISQLPITRMIQATTGYFGIGGPRGVNIEAPLRKAAGLPEVDAYEDYRVDRMLAGMAAEGSVDPDAALQAMIDRTGPAFEMAQRRVSQMGAWQYWGAPLSVDFFPEGEADQRQLKTEYDRAIAAWKDGDKGALTRFFDAYPEYETRMASFQEPEERLKKFLISEVWSAYRALPIIHQEQAREQLGDVFQDAFLNKETRSYNSITPQTLATWARAMKGRVPEAAGETPQMSLDLADDDTAALVQGFYTEKDKRFPGLSDTLDAYYNLEGAQQDTYARQHPEIDRYFKWRTQWIANNPAAIPWLTSESSELSGLPIDVQGYVYNYRAEKDRRFPTIEKLQDEYFAILDEGKRRFPGIEGLQNQYFDYPKGSRERRALLAANPQLGQYWDWKEANADAYLNQHPDLTKYWDWRKETAAMYPQAAPYILSDATLRKSILPEAEDWQPQISESIMQNLSPAMTRQLMGYLYAGQQLSTGAVMELTRVWKKAGSPGGDLETWLEGIKP